MRIQWTMICNESGVSGWEICPYAYKTVLQPCTFLQKEANCVYLAVSGSFGCPNSLFLNTFLLHSISIPALLLLIALSVWEGGFECNLTEHLKNSTHCKEGMSSVATSRILFQEIPDQHRNCVCPGFEKHVCTYDVVLFSCMFERLRVVCF